MNDKYKIGDIIYIGPNHYGEIASFETYQDDSCAMVKYFEATVSVRMTLETLDGMDLRTVPYYMNSSDKLWELKKFEYKRDAVQHHIDTYNVHDSGVSREADAVYLSNRYVRLHAIADQISKLLEDK